ncbi:MAG: hypothetical protein AAF683_05075 [Pseudomonadota bacterium]
MTFKTFQSLIISTALLAACSDGNDASTSVAMQPPAANTPPMVTSAATAETAENTSGTVYTATVMDADGDVVTFSISGGADAASFAIDAGTGALSFLAQPDFEMPGDADGDNVYMVIVSASDGNGGSNNQMVSITVTDVDEASAGVAFRDMIFSDVDVVRNVQFGSGPLSGGAEQPLFMDIFTGAGDTRRDRPVLIAAFGGGFVGGNRMGAESIARNYAMRGYVTATIDYRLITSIPTNEDDLTIGVLRALHDMYAAIRFFREDALTDNEFGVRADAILASGFSAGAILAAIANVQDESEVSLLSPDVQTFLANNGGLFGNSSANTGVSSAIQGAVVISGAVADLDTIDTGDPPFYGAHEEFDGVVPCRTETTTQFPIIMPILSGSCVITERYTSLGLPNEFFIVEGAFTHVGFSATQFQQIFDDSAAFMFEQVIEPLLSSST